MSTQMQLARAPWGLGWRLAGGASPAPGISPSSPAVPGAPEDGEPFDDSPQNQTGAPRSGLPPRRANSVGTTLMGPPASAPQPVYDNPTSLKSRIGAAIQGLGATLNPQGSGLESFLSGATGAYTRTQEGLDYNANLPYYEDRQRRTDAFTDQDNAAKLGLTGAQTDYYQGLAAREQADANAAPDVPLHQGPNGEWGQFTTGPDGKMTFVPIGGQSGRVFRGPNGELLTEDPAHPGAMVPFTGVPTKRMPTPKATPAQTAYYNAIRERMGKINMLTGEPYTPDDVAAYGESIARLVDPTFQRPTGGVPGSPTPRGAGYTSGNPFAPQP